MLDVKNLCVEYPGVCAVNEVSFFLGPGERLGIMGESGSGKSSLALALMGLLPKAHYQGHLRYEGQDLDHKTLSHLRWRSLSMVFQNGADVLNPVLTIYAQIDETLKTHTLMTKNQRKQCIFSWFHRMKLDDIWAHEYPHRLSGGMRQRVLLILALCCDPTLLILDEPTSSLDARSRNHIFDLLDDLQGEKGFSMILISHQVSAIKRLTDHLLTLYHGHLMESGPTEHVLSRPLHPYTRGLINASPDVNAFKELWGLPRIMQQNKHLSGCAFAPRCVQKSPTCSQKRPPRHTASPTRVVACNKGGIETVLRANGLSKTYPLHKGHITALDQVTIEVKSGEILAVLGQTGSGKSTLAHVLSGLEMADNGDIHLWKKGLDPYQATQQPRGLQLVFQDPFEAISHRMSVQAAIQEPRSLLGENTLDKLWSQTLGVLDQVELPKTEAFLKTPCHALSGGQRQRVALARALIMEPRILIADEITSMLDPSSRANLLRTLMGLQNTRGFSMIFITHNLFLARKVADHVMVLHHGQCVENGPSMDIFTQPQHARTRDLMNF